MSPIPILYTIPRLSIGGAQTHLLEVLRLLNRRRFSPLLCCLATDQGDSSYLIQQVRELEVPMIDAGIRNVPNSLIRPHTFLQMARVARILRNYGVQVVHSYLFPANWFGTLTARLARVPVTIASKRNVDVYTQATDRWACRMINRLADRVTAVSQTVRDHVHQTEGCPLEKIVVIPNGVDANRLRWTACELTDTKEVLGAVAGEAVIGTIARLVWYKGLEYLLKAAALIVGRQPSVRFVVVGDGPLRRPLEEKARALRLNGAVRFLGAVPNASSLLPGFDIFVLSSLWEGMSNSLLEAMAAGKPVVATDVGGGSEVVLEGKTGFLVPPKDPEALADAVLRLLAAPDLARNLGVAGRVRVESKFTLEIMVARLEELYDSLLTSRIGAL
ncbi:Glycosyltransferase, group 1 family protein [Candidatus Methylomirabilis lanthanidiphila]|uniref:Glycosyltransferase, group 1 family protein n=1 Tax=Candidatus Methylomirabilis lanthanidiphila TaxID=2211376 RepID=A0A564ZHP7_9BACT|nr:glycosyltransferase [Candidatus Methylomirabilis lanthanidiphila]VUZ84849.1 Glycosyltransferase, group 1 family protein [Candidatus Methylomirabilis lanthanidiphila]